MTQNTSPLGEFKPIQNSNGFLLNQDTKQLDMFDKIDMALFSISTFSWDVDFSNSTITSTDLENGKEKSWSFYEFIRKVHECDSDKISSMLFDNDLSQKECIDLNFRIKSLDEYRWYRVKGTLHILSKDKITASGVAIDIDHSKANIQRLEYLEHHDDLTNLKNVQMFNLFLKNVENFPAVSHALVIANIDGLKEVNDSLGYYAGNKLIQNVADVIRDSFDDAEIIARIAGGEYCAVYFGKDSLEIEMKIKEANMVLHRMYLNLIKTEVSFAYTICNGKMDFTQLYRDVTHKLSKSKNIKKLLSSKTHIDQINEIIADKAGWGKRSIRMQSLCMQIGTALRCNEDYLQEIKALAKIADIGLIGMEERLLKNRFRLGGKDRMAYQNHIECGRKMIANYDILAGFESAYLDIYKRYDEWKDGLALSSRIVAASIWFDDLVTCSDRVKFEKIKHEMQKESGGKYCPEVVDAIIRIVEKYNA